MSSAIPPQPTIPPPPIPAPPRKSSPKPMRIDNYTLAATALIFFIGGFAVASAIGRGTATGSIQIVTATPSPVPTKNYSGNADSNLTTPIPLSQIDISDGPSWGPADAKVTIVEFGDFQCPYCENFFQQTYPLLHDAYGHLIRYIFRNLPVSSHPDAYQAANAAECADEQGKFWQYHDLLYANQQDLSVTALSNYASQLKLDMTRFTACVQAEKYASKIQRDEQFAQQFGVAGTPTFLINGYVVQGAQSYEVMSSYVRYLLTQTGEVQVF